MAAAAAAAAGGGGTWKRVWAFWFWSVAEREGLFKREREREVFKTAPASGRSDIYALGTGGDIRVSGGGAE